MNSPFFKLSLGILAGIMLGYLLENMALGIGIGFSLGLGYGFLASTNE